MDCEYMLDCYYRVGERCKFFDWEPGQEKMECSDLWNEEEENTNA